MVILFFLVFVAPAAILGHLVGFTPSIGQIFRHHPADWMARHYPSVVGRFAIVDGVLLVGLIGLLLFISPSERASGSGAAPGSWGVVYAGSDGKTYTGHTRYPDRLSAAEAAKSVTTLNVDDRKITVTGFEVQNLSDPGPSATRRWRIVYLTGTGNTFVSNGRFATKAEAERVAAEVTKVGPADAQVPVSGFVVAIDPSLDPDTKKRKRQYQRDSNRSHAYCLGCYRRIYSGDRFCDCGIPRSKGWEEELQLKNGVRPEGRPAGTPPSALEVHWASGEAPQPKTIGPEPREPMAGDPPEAAVAVSRGPDPTAALPAQLRELADLHRNGALSDGEFEQAKARLLST